MTLRRSLLPLPFGFALLLAAPEAYAQVGVDWEVGGIATLGFTSNPTGTPEPTDEDPDAPGPQPDGFLTVMPQFRLTMETRDATHTLGYALGYTLYFVNIETSQFTQTLAYGVTGSPSEGTTVSFALSGGQSTTSQFALVNAAQGGQAQGTPTSDNILLTAGSGLGVSAQASETVYVNWAVSGAYAHTLIPDDEDTLATEEDTKTTTGSMSFSVGNSWERDSLGFTQSNDMQWSPAQPIGDVDVDDSIQLLHRASLDWVHQFSWVLQSQITAGALMAYDIYALRTPTPNPVARASLVWTPRRGNLSVSYSHDAAPNLLLQQITLNDTGTIAGLVELPKRVDIGGSTGLQYSRALLDSASLTGPGLAYLLDVAVGWIPPGGPLRMELRYQFTRQFGLGEDEELALFPDMQRHSVLLTSTFAYPRPPDPGTPRIGVILPNPQASVEVISAQAPRTEQAIEEERLQQQKKGEQVDDRPPPEDNND